MSASAQQQQTLKDNCQNVKLAETLQNLATQFGVELDSEAFANQMDMIDPLRDCRANFTYPKMSDLPCVEPSLISDLEQECIYLCGNSLGLKPKRADAYEKEVLDTWSKLGVFAHFYGKFPAARCDLLVKDSLAKLFSTYPDEVVCMNGLSVNMHLLLVSFYQPTETRYKILIEDHAFPSDRYGVVSQLNMRGYSEEQGLIILKSRPGEHCLRTADILSAIEEHGESIAVIFLCGVNYYTGQRFDIEAITKCGQANGCIVGWDLAHSVGNVQLKLHEWNIDFACWCSYKYLNSGAGGIGGAFVHRRHHSSARPKLSGWWSNREDNRFEMRHGVDLAAGADAYRLCNPPPALVSLHQAGLEIFEEAGNDRLLDKQYLLTGYLEFLIDTLEQKTGEGETKKKLVQIITPRDPKQRGTQLSVMFPVPLKDIHEQLEKRGVVCDIRMPNVMRIAPVPSYNSFTDVYRFFTTLKLVMKEFQLL